jgi:hypothetical protein
MQNIQVFSPYQGSNEPESVLTYIKEQFEKKNKCASRRLTFHVTTATDSLIMKRIINDVIEFVIENRLKTVGLT